MNIVCCRIVADACGVAMRWLPLMLLAVASHSALAQSPISNNGLSISLPNGYPVVSVNDMSVQSVAGPINWSRSWDGQEWKFNSQWESLSLSWKNLTGSQTADSTPPMTSGLGGSVQNTTAPGSSAGAGGAEGCWVWVDEDWQPTVGEVLIGGVPQMQAGPLQSDRMSPFNRVIGQDLPPESYPPPQHVNIDYAALCPGSGPGMGGYVQDLEAIRRINELYLGEGGRYSFSNRSTLEKRAVKALPAVSADSPYALLATGRYDLAPVTVSKGYRWIDKSGGWIDYDTQGQVTAWADRNDNTVWLVRDKGGMLRGVVDANGRVVYTLHYAGSAITEVRDYPIAGNSLDLPARSVKYEYDEFHRLAKVIDVRGNAVLYGYDFRNRLTRITDQEGHVETLAYTGDSVSKHTAADGGVTDYAFEYDDSNKQFSSKITGPETAAGRRVEDLTHNRVGKLVRRVVNGRVDDEIRYDTGTRTEYRTNARGFTTRITKNEFDQIVEIGYPDGTTVKRGYSALNLKMTEESDELDIKTRYEYDGNGNLTRKIEAVGMAEESVTDYKISNLGQMTEMVRRGRVEANGAVTLDALWQFKYDDTGQLRKAVDPEENAWQLILNRTGGPVQVVDPRGNAVRNDFDASGNLIKVTDATGRIRTRQYNKTGDAILQTDARGKTVRRVYDSMRHLVETINPAGGAYKLQYDVQGSLIKETDEDGRSVRYEFDTFLRLTRQTDALDNVTEYSYDMSDGSASGSIGSLGDPTEIRYPTFTQRRRYDARERPTSNTFVYRNGSGQQEVASSTEFSKRGEIFSEINPNGKRRLYSFDSKGQLIEASDSLGGRTKAAYNSRGDLIQVTDARGSVYKFEYDRNSRVIKTVLPLGQATSYQYDEASNLVGRVDANGIRTSYGFDAANRLVETRQYGKDSVVRRSTTFTWDPADNLTAWSDTDETRRQTSKSDSTFDDVNRKLSETISYPGGSTLSYGYGYSLSGRKIKLKWPDGTTIEYGYSAHGEVESVMIPGEGTITVNQFKWFAPEKLTLPGGGIQERRLDGLLELEQLQVKTPGQQAVLNVDNAYGKLHELRGSVRTDSAGGAGRAVSANYDYDDEVRLIRVTTDVGGRGGQDVETFTLDLVGNRIVHSRVNGEWVYDSNNRLSRRGSGTGATSYRYDDVGNLTKKTEVGGKITQYVYDTQNRMAEVSSGTGQLMSRYGYDPMGHRLWKDQYVARDGTPLVVAKRTYYLYAGEGLIAEATQDIELNSDRSVTAYGSPDLSAQYGPRPDAEFTTGIFLVKTKGSDDRPVVAYYHYDHLGTPLQATDKNGNVMWAASYNVFGQASIITPASDGHPVIESNLRFPGQMEDVEIGLHYNYHRYYDPSVGRYSQSDPIGLAGGINVYAYVAGNPLSFVDETGLDVYLCKQPAFGIENGPVDHHWIKTDTKEGGMGGTRGNVPGNDFGDLPGDPVQVTDHTGRSQEKGASCQKIDGIDENKVNDALRLGRPLGRWGPINQCQSFARGTLIDAGWKPPPGVPYAKPAPGAVPNPLPAFGF